MKCSTLFYAICFAVLAVVNVQAQSSYIDTLVANVKKARSKTESLDDVADDVNSKNAMNSGLKIVEGLYNIADLVDAAAQGTRDIPEDVCPSGGADIISAVDSFSSEYQDLIDSIGQRHDELSKAGYECRIHDALGHSEASYKSLEDGLYANLPCQKSNINDDARDLNGKFKDVISKYKCQPAAGDNAGGSGGRSSKKPTEGELKKSGGKGVVKSALGFRRLR